MDFMKLFKKKKNNEFGFSDGYKAANMKLESVSDDSDYKDIKGVYDFQNKKIETDQKQISNVESKISDSILSNDQSEFLKGCKKGVPAKLRKDVWKYILGKNPLIDDDQMKEIWIILSKFIKIFHPKTFSISEMHELELQITDKSHPGFDLVKLKQIVKQVNLDIPRTIPNSIVTYETQNEEFVEQSVFLRIILYFQGYQQSKCGFTQGMGDVLIPFLKIWNIEEESLIKQSIVVEMQICFIQFMNIFEKCFSDNIDQYNDINHKIKYILQNHPDYEKLNQCFSENCYDINVVVVKQLKTMFVREQTSNNLFEIQDWLLILQLENYDISIVLAMLIVVMLNDLSNKLMQLEENQFQLFLQGFPHKEMHLNDIKSIKAKVLVLLSVYQDKLNRNHKISQ